MIFYDTETCGLHGMAVLIQYAEDDGKVQLYSPWTNPIKDTLNLIEWMMNHEGGVVGFNLAFDHFHLCKLYTTFSLYHDHDEIPENIIDELAELEPLARDGLCLKPVTACDLMLHARKGPYQSTMDRGDIRIRRVPTALAWQLAGELEHRIPLKDIYFARRKDKNAPKWSVHDVMDSEGENDPNFKDIVLKFAPSSALKALAIDALNIPLDNLLLFGDVELGDYPEEVGYSPFAKAIGNRFDWKNTWPEIIHRHITHWNYNERARKYACDDVEYTRRLYHHFEKPELGDDDSILACMVAAVRWRGFKVDIAKLKELKIAALKRAGNTPTAPKPVQHYVLSYLDETERLVIRTKFRSNDGSTKKTILETIVKLTRLCPDCNGDGEIELVSVPVDPDLVIEFDAPETDLETRVIGGDKKCKTCLGKGEVRHPAADKAQEVIDARSALEEIEIYDKLILAGRFHASFKVIGTLSSRMSGADGLNAQGIKKTKDVRGCFPLAWDDLILCGGDFAGFEVTLAEACYNDPDLRTDLLTCEGCGNQMERINESVSVLDFLGSKGLDEYVKWRLKVEKKNLARAIADNKEYTCVSEELIRQEAFENDFICKCCGSNKGKKIHALFGMHVFPGMSYEDIKATEGTKNDIYTKCKQAVFAMFYGGEGPTLQDRLGVDLETANKAFERFTKKYRKVGHARRKINDMFCSMRQPDGLGTRVEWHEPADYIESMFGFRRYFTLENRICKTIFELSNKPPKSWKDIKIKVVRRDRQQTASGAVQSALYGASFALQASNMRAAANHEIQSSGAQVTKKVQREAWGLQPSGIGSWQIMIMNIHDELMAPCVPELTTKLKQVVNKTVETFRPKVPLIKMDWVIGLKTWAEKG